MNDGLLTFRSFQCANGLPYNLLLVIVALSHADGFQVTLQAWLR
jgi:hypothetical protein